MMFDAHPDGMLAQKLRFSVQHAREYYVIVRGEVYVL